VANNGEGNRGNSGCRCTAFFHDDQLIVNAEACMKRGRLDRSAACRETVIDALAARDAAAVRVRADGIERACGESTAAFLLAAGRFVEFCDARDSALADRVRRDPLAGARLAAARSDSTNRIAAETGFLTGARRFAGYAEAFGSRRTECARNAP
jgi:hypothetical protein